MKLSLSLVLVASALLGVSAAPLRYRSAQQQESCSTQGPATCESVAGGQSTNAGGFTGPYGQSGTSHTTASVSNNGESDGSSATISNENSSGETSAAAVAESAVHANGGEALGDAGGQAGITNPNAVDAHATATTKSQTAVIKTPDGAVAISRVGATASASDANGDSASSQYSDTSITGAPGTYNVEHSSSSETGDAYAETEGS